MLRRNYIPSVPDTRSDQHAVGITKLEKLYRLDKVRKQLASKNFAYEIAAFNDGERIERELLPVTSRLDRMYSASPRAPSAVERFYGRRPGNGDDEDPYGAEIDTARQISDLDQTARGAVPTKGYQPKKAPGNTGNVDAPPPQETKKTGILGSLGSFLSGYSQPRPGDQGDNIYERQEQVKQAQVDQTAQEQYQPKHKSLPPERRDTYPDETEDRSAPSRFTGHEVYGLVHVTDKEFDDFLDESGHRIVYNAMTAQEKNDYRTGFQWVKHDMGLVEKQLYEEMNKVLASLGKSTPVEGEPTTPIPGVEYKESNLPIDAQRGVSSVYGPKELSHKEKEQVSLQLRAQDESEPSTPVRVLEPEFEESIDVETEEESVEEVSREDRDKIVKDIMDDPETYTTILNDIINQPDWIEVRSAAAEDDEFSTRKDILKFTKQIEDFYSKLNTNQKWAVYVDYLRRNNIKPRTAGPIEPSPSPQKSAISKLLNLARDVVSIKPKDNPNSDQYSKGRLPPEQTDIDFTDKDFVITRDMSRHAIAKPGDTIKTLAAINNKIGPGPRIRLRFSKQIINQFSDAYAGDNRNRYKTIPVTSHGEGIPQYGSLMRFKDPITVDNETFDSMVASLTGPGNNLSVSIYGPNSRVTIDLGVDNQMSNRRNTDYLKRYFEDPDKFIDMAIKGHTLIQEKGDTPQAVKEERKGKKKGKKKSKKGGRIKSTESDKSQSSRLMLYKNPEEVAKDLEIKLGSIEAGNDSKQLKNEAMTMFDFLLKEGEIDKESYKKLQAKYAHHTG